MRLKKLPVFVFFALSFFCSALSDAFSESQMITFPILGFKTVPTEPIMLDVEWNEAWFGEKSAFEYHHGISRIACVFSEISYIEDVDTNPNNVIYRSYKALGIADENMLFHYNINYLFRPARQRPIRRNICAQNHYERTRRANAGVLHCARYASKR